MKNFFRVLKLTFSHKWLIAAAMSCSLAVAVLWGGNITVIFPVVDVIMLGKSIPDWVEDQRAVMGKDIAGFTGQIAALEAKQQTADEPTRGQLQQEISDLATKKRDREKKLAKYTDWYAPFAHRFLPTTPFQTLLLVCAWLAIGTFLKSVFRVAGSFFSAQLGNVVQFELRKMLFRRALRLDLASFNSYTPGDWMNRFMGNVGTAAMGAQNVYGMVLREPLKVIVCLAIAAWVSWQLLLLTLVFAPIAGYAVAWVAKALKRANRRVIKENSSSFDRLGQTSRGV
jgi:ATP-binding cassette subfamily B protein/subfamily B ATP-binding cassette protein MsbA